MTASTGAGCAVSFVSILILAAATAVQAEALVEHSLDAGQTYSTAGRIQLKDGDEERAVFQREPVTSSYWSQLQQLVQADSLYLWRVTLPGQVPVVTSIKAACLAAALPAPHYSLHLDAAGHIMSAQISVSAAAAPGGSCSAAQALEVLKGLSSSTLPDLPDLEVAVHTPTAGPAVPRPAEAPAPNIMAPTGPGAAQQQPQQAQQQRPRQQQQAGSGKGDDSESADGTEKPPPPVDDRTWLQKNWLMVLAGGMMVVNLLLKNVAEPQGQAPQQGRPVQRRPA